MTSYSLRLLIAILTLSACHKTTTSQTSTPSAESTTQPETVIVHSQKMPLFIQLTGNLNASEESLVAAGVTGKVIAVPIERGKTVSKGTVLARIDTRVLDAQLTEAKAQAQLAQAQNDATQADCKRDVQLYQQKLLSQAEYERKQAQCKAAEATFIAAQARLEQMRVATEDAAIKAPFAGVIAEKHVHLGQFVRPDSNIATLVASYPLRLLLTVPESYANDVRTGMAVEFWETSNPDKHYQTTLQYVGPSLRSASRDLIVEAMIHEHHKTLKPGMFVQARVQLEEREVPVIPKTAIRTQDQEHRVFVVKDGKLEERLVQLGTAQGDSVAVTMALSQGERIVQHVTPNLTDGQVFQH